MTAAAPPPAAPLAAPAAPRAADAGAAAAAARPGSSGEAAAEAAAAPLRRRNADMSCIEFASGTISTGRSVPAAAAAGGGATSAAGAWVDAGARRAGSDEVFEGVAAAAACDAAAAAACDAAAALPSPLLSAVEGAATSTRFASLRTVAAVSPLRWALSDASARTSSCDDE